MARARLLSALSHPAPFISMSMVVALLAVLALAVAEGGVDEEPVSPPTAAPSIPSPLPPPQVEILTPIPRQFDWMGRQVYPNPLLESLLSLQYLTPRLLMTVSLIEEYSDNFFHTESDREGEYRTRLNLGTVYRMERGNSFVSLANSVSGTYDARAERSNFGFANLAFNAGHQVSRWSFALSESFIRSDDTADASPSGVPSGVRRDRTKFLQNTVSPQALYTFAPTTSANFAYTNSLVVNEGNQQNGATAQGTGVDNSISHAFTTGLRHQFSPALLSSTRYTFSTLDSEQEPDTLTHAVSADLGYLLSLRTGLAFRAFSTFIDRSGGGTSPTAVGTGRGDSKLYGVSIGMSRQLTSFLNAFVSVGPTLVDREHRPKRVFANWQASLGGGIPLTQRTNLTFATQQSIVDTSGDVNDAGLALSSLVGLGLNHAVARDLAASVFATYSRTESLEDTVAPGSTQDQNFDLWTAGTTFSYALSRLLSLNLSYRYQRRTSNEPTGTSSGSGSGNNYDENRVTVSLTTAFSIF